MWSKRIAIVVLLLLAVCVGALLWWRPWAGYHTRATYAPYPGGPPPTKLTPAASPTPAAPASVGNSEIARSSGDGVILGRVFVVDGSPVAKASVRVVPCIEGRIAPAEQEWWATTDENGWYRVDGLGAGTYGIVAEAEGAIAVGGGKIVNVAPWERRDLILMPGRPVAGVVVDAAHKPVKDAVLLPWMRDDTPLGDDGDAWRAVLATATGGDGAFRWSLLPVGDWQVKVVASGYAPLLSDPFPAGREDLEFVLGQGGRIAGLAVLAATWEPMAGLGFEAKGPNGDTVTARSGEDGTFVFDKLIPGSYAIDLRHTELALSNSPIVAEVREGYATELRLEVLTGGVVTGMALDQTTREGVGDVQVQAQRMLDGTWSDIKKSVVSEEDGAYRLSGLAPGEYELSVPDAGDYAWMGAPFRIRVASEALVSGVDVLLDPGLELGGTVVDERNQPVSGARVLCMTESSFPSSRYARTVSDDAGRFKCRGFTRGQRILLRATTPDLESGYVGPFALLLPVGEGRRAVRVGAPEATVLSKDQLDSITIVAKSPADGILSGTVVDQTGKPLVAFINATSLVPGVGDGGARSDADGAFAITVATPGEYELTVAPRTDTIFPGVFWGLGQSAQTVKLRKGQSRTGLRLVYTDTSDDTGITIGGVVTDGRGAPIAGATVSASDELQAVGMIVQARSNPDGAFELKNLAQSSFEVSAAHRDYFVARIEGVRAGAQGIKLVLLAKPRVEGQVVNASSRQPITAFELAVQPVKPIPSYSPPDQSFQWIADPKGQFSSIIPEVPDPVLRVRAPGYETAEYDLSTVGAGQVVQGIVVALNPGALSVEGTVTDASGGPVAGASVYATDGLEGRAQTGGSPGAVSDQDGRFTLQALSESVREIVAIHSDYAPGSSPVELQPGQPAQVSIALAPGGVLEGTVREGGRPVSGATLSVFPRAGSRVETGDDGRYRISGLPAGEFTVMVRYPSDGLGERPPVGEGNVTIEPGRATELDFDM